MKNLNIDVVQRIQLIGLLSQQEGTVGQTAPFFRALELIRFNETESAQITTAPVPGEPGRVNYQYPQGDFGALAVGLEDADATAVLKMLEDWPKFRPADHAWLATVIAGLKG